MKTWRKDREVQANMRLPGGWQLPPFGIHQVLALVIVAVALWSVGLVWLALQGGQQWVGSWQQEVKVHVYVDKENRSMVGGLQKRLSKLEGVQAVRVVEQQEALLWMQKWLGGSGLDAKGFTQHLPDSIEVTLATPRHELVLQHIKEVAEKQGGSVNDDELSLAQAWDVLATIQNLAWFATLIMAMAMALIVSNTLRMILLARAEEVHLMRLMGAKEWFVRLPFILEGLLLGAGAALLAWLLQWPMLWFTSSWQLSLGIDLSGWAMLLPLLLSGALVGGLGALIATAHIVSPDNET
ncbi:MAG: permease-like cell division protein FtsX [Mariprofundaceae bacterium]|nr:permease-like cell division protein FtsX [Mariprofundaceae bacterium]